jgi:hypothetical protein
MSVIINYCSNERVFLDPILLECSKFSNDIIVSYGSHLYDGTPEDINHINEYAIKYPHIQFVKYLVDISLNLSKQKGVNKRPTAYWHNLARYNGVCHLKNKEWVFIIDSDEIPDGDRVREWLFDTKLNKQCCYKLLTYWYFKSPCNQSTTYEDSILLMHANYLTSDNIFHDWERDSLILASGAILQRSIPGLDGLPMFHHYSWCRTKEGLTHKIKHWGHSNDKFKNVNVDQLIEYIYRNDDVNDIIHNYNYLKVSNKFNIIV